MSTITPPPVVSDNAPRAASPEAPTSWDTLRAAIRQSGTPGGTMALLEQLWAAGDRSGSLQAGYDALDRFPNHADLLLQVARMLDATQAHTEARTLLQVALTRVPETPALRTALGVNLLAADRPDEAIPHLEAAVAHPEARTGDKVPLATAYAATGRLEAAAHAYKAVLDQQPNHLAAALGYGAVQSTRGEHLEALPWLERVLDITPDLAVAWSHAGRSIAALGDLDAAEAAFRCWADLESDNPDAWLSLGWTLLRKRDQAGAEKAFAEAVIYASEDPTVWVALGYAYLDTNAFEQARWSFDAARHLDASLAPAVAGAALSRFLDNQRTAAFEVLDGTTDHASHPLVAITAAWMFAQAGAGDLAHELASQALDRAQTQRDRVMIQTLLDEIDHDGPDPALQAATEAMKTPLVKDDNGATAVHDVLERLLVF